MKKEFFKIKSNCDELELDVALFIPDKIFGLVQLSHGMVEHKEYYYDFMEYLAKNGYACIINDHRGHGRSIKNISDLGYLYEESSDYLVEDLHQITMYLKNKFPNKELVLFGHSMGSLIVRKYLKKYDFEINKLIVCGSPSINKMSKIGLMLSKAVKLLKGERYRSEFLNKLALSNDETNSWISDNKEYIDKYNNDKLCGYIFTTNGFINLTNLMIDVYSKRDWKLKNKKLPIFFIAGRNDSVIKSEKLWHKSISFLKDVGYKNITFKLYDDMKHALLFEKNNENVLKDIIDFIK